MYYCKQISKIILNFEFMNDQILISDKRYVTKNIKIFKKVQKLINHFQSN